jgi:hypothetical protein
VSPFLIDYNQAEVEDSKVHQCPIIHFLHLYYYQFLELVVMVVAPRRMTHLDSSPLEDSRSLKG